MFEIKKSDKKKWSVELEMGKIIGKISELHYICDKESVASIWQLNSIGSVALLFIKQAHTYKNISTILGLIVQLVK